MPQGFPHLHISLQSNN